MDKIDELLTRGVANIIPGKAELEKVLRSDKKLNIYCGFDVTAPQLHIGNAVSMRKLQQFVELGHNVTFLIGDFTTLIGDTSDKESERAIVPEEQIEKNWQNFAKQAGKILDLSKVTIRRNSEWLDKLTPREIVRLIQRFSLNDFVSRELIKKRMTSGGSVNLGETIYPVLQGYDSYFLDTDIQVGATDQTFNMQAGRSLLKQLKNKDSFVMTFNFLTGTDGRKMSKSWNNAIWLDDSPTDMYGKVMSIKDELISEYFTLATNISIPDLTNPMAAKKQLAHQIVLELCGPKSADAAQEHFEKTIQKHGTPEEIRPSISKSFNIIDILVEDDLAKSKSEARRLVDQGGVTVNGRKVRDAGETVDSEAIIKVGRQFIKR